MYMGVLCEYIDDALRHITDGDYRSALLAISAAVDRTAKNKYREKKPGKRIKRFVREYQTLIYMCWTVGSLYVHPKATVSFLNGKEIDNVFYKLLRNPAVHGDEFESIAFREDRGIIAIEDGRLHINRDLLIGFLLSVIVDKTNATERCAKQWMIKLDDKVVIDVNTAFGNIHYVQSLTGFFLDAS